MNVYSETVRVIFHTCTVGLLRATSDTETVRHIREECVGPGEETAPGAESTGGAAGLAPAGTAFAAGSVWEPDHRCAPLSASSAAF